MKIEKPDWLEQMEGILETLNEGVIIADDCDRIVFSNQRILELTGFSPEDVLGKPGDHFYEGGDRVFIQQQIDLARRQGSNRYQFHIPQKSGGRVPVVISGRTLEDPDGRQFSVITFTDISEQKAAEDALRAANEQLAARAREIEAELELAARVQQSLAPRALRWGRVAVETLYLPVRTIGGDFGVVTPLDDGHLNLLVCDVSGHGIGSALMANRIYSETMALLERRSDLGDMLRRLNHFILTQIHVPGFFMTMAAARIHDKGCRMTYAGAGHPPAFRVTPTGEIHRIEGSNTIIGLLDGAISTTPTQELELAIGERLILYTDGLTDVFDKSGEMLGVEGLEEIVRTSASLPLTQMKDTIVRQVDAYHHGHLPDDISLVLIEVNP